MLAAYLGHVNAQNRQRYTRMSATRFAKAYGETEPGLMRLASASRTIGMRPSPAQSAYADCKSPAPKNSFRALSALPRLCPPSRAASGTICRAAERQAPGFVI